VRIQDESTIEMEEAARRNVRIQDKPSIQQAARRNVRI